MSKLRQVSSTRKCFHYFGNFEWVDSIRFLYVCSDQFQINSFKFIMSNIEFFVQKNPSTIRQPEEDRGRENYTMTSWVNLPFSSPISRHIAALCSEAADSTYISDFDINILASKPGDYYWNHSFINFQYLSEKKPRISYPLECWTLFLNLFALI